ncbi:hypothetical protein D9756_003036 [Leucocoprinus leucothites]|uniref:Uncharacterized protein n=1 Tax=Leucocoprinus leucothites TaxID=201217 RepID=A0A8H5G6U9_9AGAR|nr:hypothetical protein D9756_003036 [Leucoagaricus leucothites]
MAENCLGARAFKAQLAHHLSRYGPDFISGYAAYARKLAKTQYKASISPAQQAKVEDAIWEKITEKYNQPEVQKDTIRDPTIRYVRRYIIRIRCEAKMAQADKDYKQPGQARVTTSPQIRVPSSCSNLEVVVPVRQTRQTISSTVQSTVVTASTTSSSSNSTSSRNAAASTSSRRPFPLPRQPRPRPNTANPLDGVVAFLLSCEPEMDHNLGAFEAVGIKSTEYLRVLAEWPEEERQDIWNSLTKEGVRPFDLKVLQRQLRGWHRGGQ